MYPKKLLTRVIYLVLLIFLLNYLAMNFHWYTSIWYLDMIMHFLGGFWLGLLTIYFFSSKDDLKSTFSLLLIILFIGTGWEIFEVLVSYFTTQIPFNFFDTTSDVFFDIAGGVFSIIYFWRRIMPIKENTL